jgi:hypothetical protein
MDMDMAFCGMLICGLIRKPSGDMADIFNGLVVEEPMGADFVGVFSGWIKRRCAVVALWPHAAHPSAIESDFGIKGHL